VNHLYCRKGWERYPPPLLIWSRVSFETSFDSKKPKLEPKLVSALSETKRLFWLFRFYNERESFDVLIEPKQTRLKESTFGYFSENLGLFRFVTKQIETFFSVSRNKPKQTRNRSCFSLFRFEPKFIFVCFEDTLVWSVSNIKTNWTYCT
jgi:hypothetical protein